MQSEFSQQDNGQQLTNILGETLSPQEQHSASDCGSACIVMIGRYWGKGFSLNRLRDLTNTSRSGVSLRIATAVESIGFATRPVKASLDKFRKN